MLESKSKVFLGVIGYVQIKVQMRVMFLICLSSVSQFSHLLNGKNNSCLITYCISDVIVKIRKEIEAIYQTPIVHHQMDQELCLLLCLTLV